MVFFGKCGALCHRLLSIQNSSHFCLSSVPVGSSACRSQTATEDLINCLCVCLNV